MRRLIGIVAVLAAGAGAQAAAPDVLFAQRCAMCHQANGAGLPGQFPRLAGRAATLAQSPPGRRYLALVMLNGISGTIAADGQTYAGLMPSLAALPDTDLAAVLTHAVRLAPPAKGPKPAPFTPAEIAAVRKEGPLGMARMPAERKALAGAGLLP
ncbi:MAG: cytochrome c [Sphingomonas fennica]